MVIFSFLLYIAFLTSYDEKIACKWILEKMDLKGYQVRSELTCLLLFFLVDHIFW